MSWSWVRLGGTVSVPVPQAVWLEGGQAAAGSVAARKAAVAIFNLDLKFPELIQMGQLRLYINANIVRKHFLPLLV